jgi:alkyldihydroxyacetonephosphate synthase
MNGRLKFYGWGVENTGLDEAERGRLFRFLADRFKIEPRLQASPQVTDVALRDPRVTPPRSIFHRSNVPERAI